LPAYTRPPAFVRICAALKAIANRVRGIPGRKNFIWVTAGFPLLMGRQSFTPEFESAVRELNNAAVPVEPGPAGWRAATESAA